MDEKSLDTLAKDIKLDTDSDVKPEYITTLIPIDIANFKAEMRKSFEKFDTELSSMTIELAEVPSSESLVKLHHHQAKGRAYFERSSEIYRKYLRFLSSVSLLHAKATNVYQSEYNKALEYVRKYHWDEFRLYKGYEEREKVVKSYMPDYLHKELFDWETILTEAKTNFTIIKSYNEQFKSIREDILVQLSIIRSLITLGELKVDPEALRAFQIIEGSYVPTDTDIKESSHHSTPPQSVPMEEGIIDL